MYFGSSFLQGNRNFKYFVDFVSSPLPWGVLGVIVSYLPVSFDKLAFG